VGGVRGQLGAGSRGLTVVVAVTAGGNLSGMITEVSLGSAGRRHYPGT
jgi:hypothetical protein